MKGKEFKTIVYDKSNNIFSKAENNYNVTKIYTNSTKDYFIVRLDSSANYLYDGNINNPLITNVSYTYDQYSNVISKTQHGYVEKTGDEKYENYTFAYNTTAWILDKPTWYIAFDENHNKIRETKYFYDNKEYGQSPTKGSLTKTEEWLDTGGGNPTTRFKYDDFGNLIKQTDSLRRGTKYT